MKAEVTEYKESGKLYLTHQIEIPDDTPLFLNERVRRAVEEKLPQIKGDNFTVKIDEDKKWYNHLFFATKESTETWRKDIGADEIGDNYFRVILSKAGDEQIHVFGKTFDEVMSNASEACDKLNK
jgi:hypothetical protein